MQGQSALKLINTPAGGINRRDWSPSSSIESPGDSKNGNVPRRDQCLASPPVTALIAKAVNAAIRIFTRPCLMLPSVADDDDVDADGLHRERGSVINNAHRRRNTPSAEISRDQRNSYGNNHLPARSVNQPKMGSKRVEQQYE